MLPTTLSAAGALSPHRRPAAATRARLSALVLGGLRRRLVRASGCVAHAADEAPAVGRAAHSRARHATAGSSARSCWRARARSSSARSSTAASSNATRRSRSSWRAGTAARRAREAWRIGVDHGVFCVGCCWALMLLMFVVGTGNLGWMLVLAAVMAAEKNLPWGRRLRTPLGRRVCWLGGAAVGRLERLGNSRSRGAGLLRRRQRERRRSVDFPPVRPHTRARGGAQCAPFPPPPRDKDPHEIPLSHRHHRRGLSLREHLGPRHPRARQARSRRRAWRSWA